MPFTVGEVTIATMDAQICQKIPRRAVSLESPFASPLGSTLVFELRPHSSQAAPHNDSMARKPGHFCPTQNPSNALESPLSCWTLSGLHQRVSLLWDRLFQWLPSQIQHLAPLFHSDTTLASLFVSLVTVLRHPYSTHLYVISLILLNKMKRMWFWSWRYLSLCSCTVLIGHLPSKSVEGIPWNAMCHMTNTFIAYRRHSLNLSILVFFSSFP